ncbi:DUF7827 domain-containing protein [Haloferax larsenii]|uniref:PGF-CTERM protein/surface glycoprotein n=2 Tax=Haloferax TaxID=2251 RepID=A0A1H7QLD4_HALLR|nr:BGTF surface domain-containing protein [Haloferax larsenii]SEL48940.1 PGF-CTERM protein/surface glycoprotein [Haloferax larsenii]
MTRNKQIRAVLLAALMVFSVFAGSIAFTGSAAAEATSPSLSPSTVETGSSTTVDVTIDDDDGDSVGLHAWVDENDDGFYNASEPSVSNSSAYTGGNSGITLSSIDVSSLDAGDYDVAVAENESLTDGVTQENSSTTLTISESDAPELLSATHFETKGGDEVLELSFDEQVDISSATFDLYQDEELVAELDDNDATQSTNGQVLIDTGGELYTGDIEVKVEGVEDTAGNDLDEGLDSDNNASVTVATVTFDDTESNTVDAYKGETVAITDGTVGTDVEITSDETQDDNEGFFRSGNTGSTSEVYVFDTSERNTERYNISVAGSFVDKVQIRDLGLEVSVDDLNVTDEDLIEGKVNANADQRNIEVRLLDDDGDEVEEVTITATTDGQGEYEYEFNASSDDIDTGDYTVEVIDKASGVTVESDTITVSEAGEGKTNFASNVVTDQRGDVVAIPVTLSNTDQATVTIGTNNQGYEANVTVEDGDEDGEVVVLWDSSNSESSTVGDVFDVEDGDDEILTGSDGDTDVSNPTSDLIDSGDYDLEVRTGTDDAKDADNVGTLVLEDASVDTVAMWTAPDAESFSDLDDVNEALENGNITQDSKIAFGDKAVVEIVAPGLEGSVGAQDDETPNFFSGDYNDSYRLTVNQSNPGPNRDAKIINVSNASVIADGDNDTYFVVFNTEEIEAVRDEDDDGVIDNGENTDVDLEDDDAFNVEFKMIADEDVSSSGIGLVDEDTSMATSFENVEAEHTFDMDPANVTNAEGQTVTGTTDVAPGTELTIRVKSDGDTQPRFLKTATAYVTENNTFSATFDFSGQNVGDTFTVTASGAGDVASDEEVDGNVVESVETATPTPEETTETPEQTTETPEPTTETPEPTTETSEPTTETTETTSSDTPGFGIAVALVALVAAALLAVRRD